VDRVGLVVGARYSRQPGDIGNWTLSRTGRARQWRIRRTLLRERSCRRGHSLSSGTVREVIPTDADARPEEHSDNCTQPAGPQFQSVHGRWFAVRLQTAMPKFRNPITEAYQHNLRHQPHRRSSWPVWNRTRSRSPSLVTSVEFPITPIRITVAVAQSGWHLSAVPAPLLAVSGPTGWCAAAVPAFPSPGTAELVRRACAVEVMRAGNVCIRCSGRAVTWLAQPTGTRSAHLPSTPSVAARESRRGDRDR